MTHQEFNHFFYKFTNNDKGIRLHDQIRMSGYDLKEFVEFVINKVHEDAFKKN